MYIVWWHISAITCQMSESFEKRHYMTLQVDKIFQTLMTTCQMMHVDFSDLYVNLSDKFFVICKALNGKERFEDLLSNKRYDKSTYFI